LLSQGSGTDSGRSDHDVNAARQFNEVCGCSMQGLAITNIHDVQMMRTRQRSCESLQTVAATREQAQHMTLCRIVTRQGCTETTTGACNKNSHG
jgi:hypothetical protein